MCWMEHPLLKKPVLLSSSLFSVAVVQTDDPRQTELAAIAEAAAVAIAAAFAVAIVVAAPTCPSRMALRLAERQASWVPFPAQRGLHTGVASFRMVHLAGRPCPVMADCQEAA